MNIEDLSESKSTKSEAHYQSNPHAGQRCINCTMWRDPNKCSAVAGNISTDGWCDYWAPGAYGKHGSAIGESEILDEGWRENLYKLVTIGALSLTTAAAITSKNTYDKWASTHPKTVQMLDTNKDAAPTVSRPINKTPAASTNRPTTTPTTQPTQKSNLAPTASPRPMARPPELTKTPIDQARPKHKPSLDTLGTYSKPLHDAAVNAGITGIELVALMAQAAHETRMFTKLEETGDEDYFNKYDPEFAQDTADLLGNTEEGDGFTYRGRGYLHLTGKYNYQKAQDALGYPLVDQPELAADPQIAAEIAIWFWENRVQPRVTDFNNIKSVTHPINSKYNGLADRKEKFKYIASLVKKFNIDLDERLAEDFNRRPVTSVDVNAIHAEAIREHLLSHPKLYEDTIDYKAMQKFLNLHKTSMPEVGQEYVYASILSVPTVRYLTTAHFNAKHKLTKIDGKYAYFEIDGDVKRFPETGTLDGDALSHIYFFNSVKDFQHFIMLLELKFSDYTQTFKILDNPIVSENFKDGKNPGRKGLAKRSGVNTKASVSSLRKTAKNSTGEKQRMAHWLANMKSGRKKASESDEQPRYTASEWAIIEGGHTLEEQVKPKLFSWLLNTDKDI